MFTISPIPSLYPGDHLSTLANENHQHGLRSFQLTLLILSSILDALNLFRLPSADPVLHRHDQSSPSHHYLPFPTSLLLERPRSTAPPGPSRQSQFLGPMKLGPPARPTQTGSSTSSLVGCVVRVMQGVSNRYRRAKGQVSTQPPRGTLKASQRSRSLIFWLKRIDSCPSSSAVYGSCRVFGFP